LRRVGATFAQHVVTAIDIGMDHTPITGTIPTTSDPFPRERRASLPLGRIGRDGVKIKKTGFTGVAFLVGFYDNADQFPLVAKVG